jgi:hypothetical protein
MPPRDSNIEEALTLLSVICLLEAPASGFLMFPIRSEVELSMDGCLPGPRRLSAHNETTSSKAPLLGITVKRDWRKRGLDGA